MGSTMSNICWTTSTSDTDSSSLSSSNTTETNDGFKTPTDSYIPNQTRSPPLLKKKYKLRKRADSM